MKFSAWSHQDAGLLLIRLALGVPFVAHGWQKLAGMEQTVGFFSMLGVPAPMAWLVALVEVIGGLAIIVGFGVKWAAYLLAVIMFFAILLVKGKMGFLGGYELELILFLLALGVAFLGSGSCSLDAVCRKKKGHVHGPACKDGACAMPEKK